MKHPLRAILFVPASDENPTIEARRCGLFEDLYADREGNLYQIKRVSIYEHNKSPVFRYGKSNLAAIHAMGDAWLPGWEDNAAQLVPLDGNRMNIRLENIGTAGEARRGRPRSAAPWRKLKARQLWKLCKDVDAVAETLEMPKREVRLAIQDLIEGAEDE